MGRLPVRHGDTVSDTGIPDIPTLVITPDIWRLKVLDDERYGMGNLGVHLNGTHARATNGQVLVVIEHTGPAMHPDWRLRFHYPNTLRHGYEVHVPCAVGLHAVNAVPSTKDKTNWNKKIPVLVEIVDVRTAYPNVTSVTDDIKNRKKDREVGLSPFLIDKMARAIGIEKIGGGYHPIKLAFGEPLQPVVYDGGTPRTHKKVIGVIMPVRID